MRHFPRVSPSVPRLSVCGPINGLRVRDFPATIRGEASSCYNDSMCCRCRVPGAECRLLVPCACASVYAFNGFATISAIQSGIWKGFIHSKTGGEHWRELENWRAEAESMQYNRLWWWSFERQLLIISGIKYNPISKINQRLMSISYVSMNSINFQHWQHSFISNFPIQELYKQIRIYIFSAFVNSPILI